MENEHLLNDVMDSLYHCIDLLSLLTEEQNLNKNISFYMGPLKILKKELMNDIVYFEQFTGNKSLL